MAVVAAALLGGALIAVFRQPVDWATDGWFEESEWRVEFARALERPAPDWLRLAVDAQIEPADARNYSARARALVHDYPRVAWARALVLVTLNGRHVSSEPRMSDGGLHALVAARLPSLLHALEAMLAVAPVESARPVTMLFSLDDALDDALPVALPVFVFAKDTRTAHAVGGRVLVPDFETLGGLWPLRRALRAARQARTWAERKPIAVFRGSTTGGGLVTEDNLPLLPRARAAALSRRFPSLVDARLTALVQCTAACDRVRALHEQLFGDELPLALQLRARYLLVLDGNTVSYTRTVAALMSGSLALKQRSPHVQWYFFALRPMVHYVPVAADVSDTPSVVLWARAHDDQAQQIAAAGENLAHRVLRHSAVMHYLHVIVTRWAARCGDADSDMGGAH